MNIYDDVKISVEVIYILEPMVVCGSASILLSTWMHTYICSVLCVTVFTPCSASD